MDDRQRESRVTLVLADRRVYRHATKTQVHFHRGDVPLVIPDFDLMSTADRFAFHLFGDRRSAIASEPVHAGPNQKMGSRLLSRTEQFEDVTLAVAHMHAPGRIGQLLRGL